MLNKQCSSKFSSSWCQMWSYLCLPSIFGKHYLKILQHNADLINKTQSQNLKLMAACLYNVVYSLKSSYYYFATCIKWKKKNVTSNKVFIWFTSIICSGIRIAFFPILIETNEYLKCRSITNVRTCTSKREMRE